MRRLDVASVLAASFALVSSAGARAFTLPVTGPADAPRMEFDARMRVDSVCLPVRNPAGGANLLYGQGTH